MIDFSNLYYYRSVEKLDKPETIAVDLCIYGASSAGIAAAVQARRMGLQVAIAEFGNHLGGLTSGGLGATDIGNKAAIGGISREFYQAVGNYYGTDREDGTQWTFEPGTAKRIYEKWLNDLDIKVYYGQQLAEVRKVQGRIASILMENGNTFTAPMFIDATYEGDLLARAGVSYHVGREGNRMYKETLNGVYFGHHKHDFQTFVDPYVIEGKPDSGLLAGIMDEPPGYHGQGDHRVQAYNFRICLTNRPDNRIAFPEPPEYQRERYALLSRYINTGIWDTMGLHTMMPNGKSDLNNWGGISTDNIGLNYEWPDGDYATRERIFQDHFNYNLGMLYFLANDESIPEHIRREVNQWGLPADEYANTGHWSPQLYIREARRMIADIVMTEHHCRKLQTVEDSVGLAAYTMDSHHCRRLVLDERCITEGCFEVPPSTPYPISYRAIVPKGDECENLLVPICLSASHVAYGSIRMEPVFMILGQSAATAAALALDKGCAVQEIPYRELRERLLQDGQVLQWHGGGTDPKQMNP